MNEISQTQVRLQNWQMMYSEYVNSWLTGKEWCKNNNINVKIFYYRLKRLRMEAVNLEQHDIVTVYSQCLKYRSHPNKRTWYNIRTAEGYIFETSCSISERLVVMLKEERFDRIYLVYGYADMWQSINGLATIIQQNFGLEPCSGILFLFRRKRRDRLKALL